MAGEFESVPRFGAERILLTALREIAGDIEPAGRKPVETGAWETWAQERAQGAVAEWQGWMTALEAGA